MSAAQRFKPYPAYRHSGVEWLGEIPAHWEIRRLRHIVHRIEQGWSPECENREAAEEEWGVLKAGCVNRGVFVASEHKALPSTLQPIPDLEINRGDLLMSRASGSRELVGSVAVVPECRPRLLLCDKLFRLQVDVGAEKRFLSYAINSRIGRWQIELVLSGGSGLANNIAQGVVKDLTLAIPEPEEQRAIAAFVDRETARIDALVAKKERLIELLQEKRTALITRAVTKGLDPNVPMKDSGVEWLGEIPAHWELKPLKYLLEAPLAYGVLKPDKYQGDDGVPLIRILDVEMGLVREAQLDLISPEQSLKYRRTAVNPGDLVVSVVGTIGRSFIVPPSLAGANLSRALARVQPNTRLIAAFLEYCFSSTPFASFVDLIPAGTAQRVLNLGDLNEFIVPLPSDVEQRQIVAFVDVRIRRLV